MMIQEVRGPYMEYTKSPSPNQYERESPQLSTNVYLDKWMFKNSFSSAYLSSSVLLMV